MDTQAEMVLMHQNTLASFWLIVGGFWAISRVAIRAGIIFVIVFVIISLF